MHKEITARKLLSHVTRPDPWFGIKHSMNIYRGCEHQCIYCDSRSECYGIEDFSNLYIKVNALELLERELFSLRTKGTIGTGAMNDPYTKAEQSLNLTRGALQLIARYRFPVHILTKSNLVLRDLDLLKIISGKYAAVSFTITTADQKLAAQIEPGASLPKERFKAIKKLSEAGIYTGIYMMPILPFLEDNEENIKEIVNKAALSGAKYIIPWFGMTLRDRQRGYYYQKLDQFFPGVKRKYINTYGNNYQCAVINAKKLSLLFARLCQEQAIATQLSIYQTKKPAQLSLFEH